MTAGDRGGIEGRQGGIVEHIAGESDLAQVPVRILFESGLGIDAHAVEGREPPLARRIGTLIPMVIRVSFK